MSTDLSPHTLWDISDVIARLRVLRETSLVSRQRLGRSTKLPSHRVLERLLEGLNAVLFPNRLGPREMGSNSVDYFVGRTIDDVLCNLLTQVMIELQFTLPQETSDAMLYERAQTIVRRFAEELPRLRELLEGDLESAHMRDTSAQSLDELLVCHPGVSAIIAHRIAHILHQLGVRMIARVIAAISQGRTGIHIHPAAQMGVRFSIAHATGIVIGETAVIGDRVCLHHGVTLGEWRMGQPLSPQFGTRRHPLLEDDVAVYAGATLLGPITVGRGSVIGGNVSLTVSVPPFSQVSQATSRRDEFLGGAGI